jgi:hypothetical protein
MVAHLVEAPYYKPEISGFDFWWDLLDSSLTLLFRPYYVSGIDPDSKRNEYQSCSWEVKAADA